ncbi:hypothetical protein K461DRAFT_301643 [Myriangium duriaei CBS 260.36]|uniref:Uncharacterized protein n=1 Tax=Myriangium duriaei CBS 260.36 TaxID=1168546 RepID=A0A9P4MDN8_9PEZI|nr:hypothetical protein K461DRAFT_301643 [Myriangium duriaei CBS 260.36]
MVKILLALTGLVAAVDKDFSCSTNKGSFKITYAQAQAAAKAGGVDRGLSRYSSYPHPFHGGSGSGTYKIVFYDIPDKQCNRGQGLLEYPVYSDGTAWEKQKLVKDIKKKTPARVVYLQHNLKICGVMVHVIEDKGTGQGSGDFRVCDKVK